MTFVSSPTYNVIKVGSRFHLIHNEKNEIQQEYYITQEEAEKKCDEKNDAIRRAEHDRTIKLERERERERGFTF